MRFVADRMLGKLAKVLRILGFDTMYSNSVDFEELLCIGRKEKRIVLTRNTLIRNKGGKYAFLFIHDDDPKAQFEEVRTRLNLNIDPAGAFTRCILCNNELKKIKREDVEGDVPDYVFQTHRDFSSCAKCKRIFWKGTHYENMLTLFGAYATCASEEDA